MSKQTAVEWLIEQIFLNKKYISYEESVVFEKAKAMEREQIEEAYKSGYEMALTPISGYCKDCKQGGEQ